MARLLLDECVDRRLKNHLRDHDVRTVAECGWMGMKNGALLGSAANSFDVFVTIDRGIAYQQSLRHLDLAIAVLVARSSRLADLLVAVPALLDAIPGLRPGTATLIDPGGAPPGG